MKVDGTPYRTIWLTPNGKTVQVIDQTLLPHDFVVRDLDTVEDAERIAAGLPHAQLTVIPHCRHLMNWDAEAIFTPLLMHWLAGVTGQG